MSRHSRRDLRARTRSINGGFILVAALLFMLVLLILSAAMFRSVGQQEAIAGDTRDKERSFEAAQSALQYGEWWLVRNGSSAPVACSTTNNPIGSLPVCADSLANPAQLPWPAWTTYTPPGMQVADGGGLASNGDINYKGSPGLHLSYLGLTPDGLGSLYQVTAFGMGGSFETRTVVQSVYRLQASTRQLDQQ